MRHVNMLWCMKRWVRTMLLPLTAQHRMKYSVNVCASMSQGIISVQVIKFLLPLRANVETSSSPHLDCWFPLNNIHQRLSQGRHGGLVLSVSHRPQYISLPSFPGECIWWFQSLTTIVPGKQQLIIFRCSHLVHPINGLGIVYSSILISCTVQLGRHMIASWYAFHNLETQPISLELCNE